jgi:hypothetical protein
LGDAQFAKRLVECLVHGQTLDVAESDADFATARNAATRRF